MREVQNGPESETLKRQSQSNPFGEPLSKSSTLTPQRTHVRSMGNVCGNSSDCARPRQARTVALARLERFSAECIIHRLTSFFSFLRSRLVGFVSQLNKQLSPTSLQFANG